MKLRNMIKHLSYKCFFAPEVNCFMILFAIVAAGVVPCDGHQTPPRKSTIYKWSIQAMSFRPNHFHANYILNVVKGH